MDTDTRIDDPVRLLMLSRRAALLGLTSAVTLGRVSLALAAAPTDRRFVVVMLRGALDGLAAVVPYGDPALLSLRGELVAPEPGQPGGLLDLGGFFGLHPALVELHGMFRAGELLPVHAVAGPTRSRSHFEAQDSMESGTEQRMTSGWLNRVVTALPARGLEQALAIGLSVPLLLRGPAEVAAYAPPSFVQPQADLYAKLAALHDMDPVTGPALRRGLLERGLGTTEPSGATQPNSAFVTLAGVAGRRLGAPDGPRIAALELGGWDTHAAQTARLAGPLQQLDAGIRGLRDGLGDAWRQSVVLIVTEFGRTVRVNGTRGTDHGTGGIALVAGGGVAGGHVLADWPGLTADRLLDNRDLQPTRDVRAVARGLLIEQFGLSDASLAKIFPTSNHIAPQHRLLRG